mmetsp:Transcript_83136/g.209558  ORF Transcript_83136/g.209558 Transcript_83136/m.209558 type:complete len:453 (-) Transcript_83136:80-1438(-)
MGKTVNLLASVSLLLIGASADAAAQGAADVCLPDTECMMSERDHSLLQVGAPSMSAADLDELSLAEGPIEWSSSGATVGDGHWCQTSAPSDGWTLKHCSAGTDAGHEVKVLTYNLFWWNLYGVRHGNGDSASHLIQAMSHPVPFDVMGFQECEDGNRVLAAGGLAGQYQVFMFGPMSKTTALCMAFRKASFSLISQGQAWVAEDEASQYFGKRALQWMRLHHTVSGRTLFFANHHGPLRVGSGGKCGGGVTGLKLLTAIAQNAKPGDAIVLLGDFNAGPGSATLNQVGAKLKDFYPAGIDNVFTNLPPQALVGKADIGNGGSDHDALMVQVVLGGGGQWPHPPAPMPGKQPPPPLIAPPPKPLALPPSKPPPGKPLLGTPPPLPRPDPKLRAAPPPEAMPAPPLWFDCHVDVPRDWSELKRTWCCTKKGVACTLPQAALPSAGPVVYTFPAA